MMRPRFWFERISFSDDGNALDCSCKVAAHMPFFNGHFPNMPIMPAVAQIEMIQSLLQQHSPWETAINNGSKIKFSGRIVPSDVLAIRLQYKPGKKIGFEIRKDSIVVTSGSFGVERGIDD